MRRYIFRSEQFHIDNTRALDGDTDVVSLAGKLRRIRMISIKQLQVSKSISIAVHKGFLVFMVVSIMLASCTFENQVNTALEIIDNGIRDIERNSSGWQSILQRVSDQLPKDVSEAIRVDAQNLATRSIGTTGTEFRCNVDFLGDRVNFLSKRAIQSLQHLKAELLNQNTSPLPPAFCQVSPASIDLNTSPDSWSTLFILGYDLDQKDISGETLKILLLNDQGGTTILPEDRIGRTTHYQITLNLGGMARQLYNDKITKLLVSWNNSTEKMPQVVVIPWKPVRVEERVPLGATPPYIPPRTAGDGDFDTSDGNSASLEVREEVQVAEQGIATRVYMHARESEPDHTEIDGWSEWTPAYTPPRCWKLISVNPQANSVQTAQVTTHDRLVFPRPAGEVADYFEVWVDRDDDEAGTWSRVVVHLRDVDIVREELVPEWLC